MVILTVSIITPSCLLSKVFTLLVLIKGGDKVGLFNLIILVKLLKLDCKSVIKLYFNFLLKVGDSGDVNKPCLVVKDSKLSYKVSEIIKLAVLLKYLDLLIGLRVEVKDFPLLIKGIN